VSARGGQSVFATSAPTRAKARSRAATPSARSATADLRNGFRPGARSSLFAAEAASAGQGQGIGAPLAAALGLLGLGLAGAIGSSLVFGLRRRGRASAGTGSEASER